MCSTQDAASCRDCGYEWSAHPINLNVPISEPAKPCSRPAAGSATPEEWWAKRASEIAEQMKQGGVGELRLRRLPTGKYEFEITPEGWPNDQAERRG